MTKETKMLNKQIVKTDRILAALAPYSHALHIAKEGLELASSYTRKTLPYPASADAQHTLSLVLGDLDSLISEAEDEMQRLTALQTERLELKETIE